jgi:hypothetical protein
MKTLVSVLLTLLLITPAIADQARDDKQAQLDATCETVRQHKLAPLREGFVEQCVANGELPSHDECQRFYADYGNKMGGRAPLFYDLPACVKAFEYGQSSRN